MNNNRPVLRLANDIYENNAEMLAIYNTQSDEISSYEAIIQRVFLNNLVKYCNIEGIRRFEDIFNIQADEVNESLELRKQRVINKFSQLPPFTKIFVQQMLEYIFGNEMWEFEIYYNNYKVKIGIESSIDGIVTETLKDLRQIIPANIIIEQIVYYPYTHGYLKRHYTHSELTQFKQEELSQYA
jgi:hypothetical protein